MKKVMLLLCLCLVISACAKKEDEGDKSDTGSEISSQSQQDNEDHYVENTAFADLKMLDSVAVQVIPDESANAFLDMTAMTDYAILKFKDNCRDIPIVSLDKPLEVGRGTHKIYITVVNLDDGNHIQYVLRNSMEIYQSKGLPWGSDKGGYYKKEILENEVKKDIDSMMEEFARVYYIVKEAK